MVSECDHDGTEVFFVEVKQKFNRNGQNYDNFFWLQVRDFFDWSPTMYFYLQAHWQYLWSQSPVTWPKG